MSHAHKYDVTEAAVGKLQSPFFLPYKKEVPGKKDVEIWKIMVRETLIIHALPECISVLIITVEQFYVKSYLYTVPGTSPPSIKRSTLCLVTSQRQ